MTPKQFFRAVSSGAAVLLGVAAVVWALLFLKLISVEPGSSLFFLSAMEDLAQTKFATGMGAVPLNTSVLLIGVSLVLSAVLSWLSHTLRERVIRYRLDHGEVTVPIHMVEQLVLNMVNHHPGLSLTDVRFYKRHGKPSLSLQLDADYNSPYRDTVSSLKKRLIREVDSYAGVTLGRVDVRIELVGASSRSGAAGIAHMEAVSEAEGSGNDDLGEMTNQVYEESLADLEEVVSTLNDEFGPIDLSLGVSEEVVSTLNDELGPIDLSLGVSVETEAQDQDIHYQEIRPSGAHNPYYSAIDAMEKAGVNREYIVGWACGYLHNPIREEQCLNEAYETGYEDGMGGDTSSYQSWVSSGESPTSQHIS